MTAYCATNRFENVYQQCFHFCKILDYGKWFEEPVNNFKSQIKTLGALFVFTCSSHTAVLTQCSFISASFSFAPVAFALALLSSETKAQLHQGVR